MSTVRSCHGHWKTCCISINNKDIHSVNITLLQSAERYRTEGLNMRGYEITFPSSLWYNIGASNNAKYAPGSNFLLGQELLIWHV